MLGSASYRVSLYVFGLLSLIGVLFGRLVCSFLCPFGLVQDLLYKIPLGKKYKNLPGHKYLKYMRYVFLVVFVILLTSLAHDASGIGSPWFCEWICPSGTLFAGIPLLALNPELRTAIGPRFYWKLFLLIVMLLSAIRWYRPFCKYVCPLGAIYGVFNPVSTYRIIVDHDKCVKCGACQKACGMDIKTFETPNSPDCIRCGDCMATCPTGALDSTWNITRKKIVAKSFVDDVPSAAPTSANPYPKHTIALAILLIVAGASTIYIESIGNLYNNFNLILMLDSLRNSGIVNVCFSLPKIIASVIVMLTGIYLIMKRNDPDRAATCAEKLVPAIWLPWVGFVLGIVISLAAIRGGLQYAFNTVLYNPCPYVIFIVLWGLARMLKSGLEGKKLNNTWFIILFVIVALVMIYPIRMIRAITIVTLEK